MNNLGKLLGKIHSVPLKENLKTLPDGDGLRGYGNYLDCLKKKYIPYFNQNFKQGEFLEMTNSTFFNLKENIPKQKYKPKIVFSHGDFHEMNLLLEGGKFKLIDFEEVSKGDSAVEIAKIFMEFDRLFDDGGRNNFLTSYSRNTGVNKEKISKKVFTWLPLKYFGDFLWSVNHVLKIKNREGSSEFLENVNISSEISYAKKAFRKCLREGVINPEYKKLDLDKILK